MGYTGFHWLYWDFFSTFWVLIAFNGFYRVLLSFDLVILGFTVFYSV